MDPFYPPNLVHAVRMSHHLSRDPGSLLAWLDGCLPIFLPRPFSSPPSRSGLAR